MKAFIQTNLSADAILPVQILTKRLHEWNPAAEFIREWSAKAPYSLEIDPQDYRVMFTDGTQAIGFLWGDESCIPLIQAYIADKFDRIDKGLLDPGATVTGTEMIVVADDEHPIFKFTNVKNYSLGNDPYNVIEVSP